MDKPTKYREDQLRRVAQRQGLMLVKGRRRDPRALDYRTYTLREGDRVVLSTRDLNEIEGFLTKR